MKKSTLLGIGLVVTIVLVVARSNQPPKPVVDDQAHVVTEVPAAPAPTAVVSKSSPVEAVQVQPKIAKVDPRVVTAIAPSRQELRDEVEKNPHQTPRVLLGFAAQLGTRMDQLGTDENQASRLLGELADCVGSTTETPVTVRAICLTNAKRLASRFPNLQDETNKLVASAPHEVTRLIR